MPNPRVPRTANLPSDIPGHWRQAISEYIELVAAQTNRIAHDMTAIATSQPVSSSIVLVDATASPVTVTLPPALNWRDDVLRIKKMDTGSNTVAVVANGTEKIDETSTIAITVQYVCIQCFSDGEQWYIV